MVTVITLNKEVDVMLKDASSFFLMNYRCALLASLLFKYFIIAPKPGAFSTDSSLILACSYYLILYIYLIYLRLCSIIMHCVI